MRRMLALLIGFVLMSGADGQLQKLYVEDRHHLCLEFGEKINLKEADLLENYTLSSEEDENFVDGVHPEWLARKTKPRNMKPPPKRNIWKYTPVLVHWIYLEFPEPIRPGLSYTISVRGVTKQGSHLSFKFVEEEMWSPAIKVNQVGYLPDAPMKFAYLGDWMGGLGSVQFNDSAQEFRVIDLKSRNVVFRGKPLLRKKASTKDEDAYRLNLQNCDIYDINFSEFNRPGTYRIVVSGVGCSYPFRVSTDVYEEAFYVSIRGLYYQRCGIALKKKHAGQWTKGACHRKPVILSTVTLEECGMGLGRKDAFKELPRTATDKRAELWGGYHDAGDYDRRAQHIKISDLLLDLYEMAPSAFTDNQLNIPESGNGIPDIVDEANWNLEFWRRLQGEDGGVRGGIESERHPYWTEPPGKDPLNLYAYGEGLWVSLRYAGCSSKLSRILRLLGREKEAELLLHSARRAWKWARARSPVLYKDALAYASAELFKTTLEDEFQKVFLKFTVFTRKPDAQLSVWKEYDQHDSAWAYATTSHHKVNRQTQQACRKAFIREADEWLRFAKKRAFRFAKHPWAPIGWGSASVPQAIPLIRAHYLTGKEEYLAWTVLSADFSLGCNPLNIVWTSGLGSNPVRRPLHLQSMNDSIDEPVPGITVFGPSRYSESKGILGFALRAYFPPVGSWPLLERYSDVGYAPEINEFTVQQCIAPTAFVYGYIYANFRK